MRLASRLGLTVGDPAGVGPEIVLKALQQLDLGNADVTVYGPRSILDERARLFGLRPVGDFRIQVRDTGTGESVSLGRLSSAAGRMAAEAVLAAASDAMEGRIQGIVTAPLNKEALKQAGYAFPGHTEMLADAAGVRDVVMMFVGGGLRVALVTIHRSLQSVPGAVTTAEVVRVTRLVHRWLPRFGVTQGTIAVCGLNPHAGEGGLFGHDEEERIVPAIQQLRGEGIDVAGPFPADTVFVRAQQGSFAAVIAQYHDQGLIPVKLAAFGHAVNVTLGLPFVRTSVDHGTAFDIAAQGVASEKSLLEAIAVADGLCQRELAPATSEVDQESASR
jgi:4-hydroxythreonine-4-phosphate dehydrogenase